MEDYQLALIFVVLAAAFVLLPKKIAPSVSIASGLLLSAFGWASAFVGLAVSDRPILQSELVVNLWVTVLVALPLLVGAVLLVRGTGDWLRSRRRPKK